MTEEQDLFELSMAKCSRFTKFFANGAVPESNEALLKKICYQLLKRDPCFKTLSSFWKEVSEKA